MRKFNFIRLPFMYLLEVNGDLFNYEICKRLGCTFSYSSRFLKDLEENKIIKREKIGRMKILHLTDKGEKIREGFNNILEVYENGK